MHVPTFSLKVRVLPAKGNIQLPKNNLEMQLYQTIALGNNQEEKIK
jgi:hypothetical protein